MGDTVYDSILHLIGIIRFLPYLLGYEWFESDPQLARDCQTTLACLSRTQLTVTTIQDLSHSIRDSLEAGSWRTRLATLDFLQTVIFNNFMLICSINICSSVRDEVIKMVMKCLNDVQIEVRVKAAQVGESFLNI